MKMPMIGVSLENRILIIRGYRVMLDQDLALLYGVSTKVLNQTVKRQMERFPTDFMFRLTPSETKEVVTNCDHLKSLKYSHVLPNAFTEHGAITLAHTLNSRQAVQSGILIVRAFVRFRELLSNHKDLARKLEELEKKYDSQFKDVFDAIRELMDTPALPPEKKHSRVPVIKGFTAKSRELRTYG